MENVCIEKLFGFKKNDLMEKMAEYKIWWIELFGFKNWLDGKIACIEKLLGFKNWLDGKIAYTRKLLGFKNWLDGNTAYTRKLLGFKNWLDGKTPCTKKLFEFKNWLYWNIVLLKLDLWTFDFEQ
jgi:hypothetical protein